MYGNKHEGLRTSSPPARTCDTTSPRRREIPSASQLPLVYAQPTSVHFGGFALGQSYQQRVFIHNRSSKPVRLQYTMPSKGLMRAAFARERKPFVSAGLSEELVVTFKASAFQYHYDCIQVRCEEVAYASNTDIVLLDQCLVPIHAYPVLNKVQFPSRMDFGVVPLGGIGKKYVDLTCSVPIEFEYELELTKAHPSFTIFPLRGVIPANGSARIELEFRPLVFATASAEIVLHVSQLGFTPMLCALAGSSSMDAARDAVMSVDSSATASSSPSKTASRRRPPAVGATEQTSSNSPTKSPVKSACKSRKRDASSSKSTAPVATSPTSEMLGGFEIPADLSSMASVNFVLTQQPGKLKPKDLKKAVAASRELRKRQKEEQAKLNGSNSDNSHNAAAATQSDHPQHERALTFSVLVREEETFLTHVHVSRQIKEMYFMQELSDLEQMERDLEFQSHKIHLGSALLTSQQLAFLQQARALNALELERREREKLRASVATVAFNAQSQPSLETPWPPRATLPAHYVPTFMPDFKAYKNDLWARRKRVVQRFVRAVSTCVLRLRAQRRLMKIQHWLGGAKTRAQVREKVALDWQRHSMGAAASALQSTGVSNTQSRNDSIAKAAQTYFVESFPLVDEQSHAPPREFIAQPVDWDLKCDAFTFFELRERDEALVSGHELLELPPLETYVPLESSRMLRSGAADECNRPCHALPDDASRVTWLPRMDTRTPSLLAQLPSEMFVRPSASVRPLVRIQSPRETDAWFILRPQRVFRTLPTHFGAVQEQRVGQRSLVALQNSLLSLHTVYQPSTDRARAQPLVHFASTTAAAAAADENNEELYESVWYISQRQSSGIPRLAERADDVPCLSDSESDDEANEHEIPSDRKATSAPTWADALRLFDDQSGSEGVGNSTTSDALEAGELLGRARGVSSFPRYRHLIRQERAYNTMRESQLQLLPNRLEDVAAAINDLDVALVVEGHGPERSLHQRSHKTAS